MTIDLCLCLWTSIPPIITLCFGFKEIAILGSQKFGQFDPQTKKWTFIIVGCRWPQHICLFLYVHKFTGVMKVSWKNSKLKILKMSLSNNNHKRFSAHFHHFKLEFIITAYIIGHIYLLICSMTTCKKRKKVIFGNIMVISFLLCSLSNNTRCEFRTLSVLLTSHGLCLWSNVTVWKVRLK